MPREAYPDGPGLDVSLAEMEEIAATASRGLVEGDPRKIAHAALTYFTNNRSRMDYPGYRREGLPVTGSPAESLVKPIKRRVKGAEKFGNDGPSGEAILQLRAAVLRGCPETNLSAANDLRQVTRGLGWLRRGEVAENPPC